jgi:hypothetical protein
MEKRSVLHPTNYDRYTELWLCALAKERKKDFYED